MRIDSINPHIDNIQTNKHRYDEELFDFFKNHSPAMSKNIRALLAWITIEDTQQARQFMMSLKRLHASYDKETQTFNAKEIIAIEIEIQHLTIDLKINDTEIHIQFDSLRLEFSHLRTNKQTEKSDPLVLTKNDTPPKISNNKIQFDLNADGQIDSFTPYKGYYLALDRNNNGSIDNGSELFGDQHGQSNGFSELQTFDHNSDGFITNEDSVYKQLKLYNLENQNLISLHSYGVPSLSLQSNNIYPSNKKIDFISTNSSYNSINLWEAWHHLNSEI